MVSFLNVIPIDAGGVDTNSPRFWSLANGGERLSEVFHARVALVVDDVA